MSDLDEIRRKRMAELEARQAAAQGQMQQQAQQQMQQQEAQRQFEEQKKALRGKVTDEQLKVLLRQIAGQKREIKITRK